MTQPILMSELCVAPESCTRPIANRGLRLLCRLGRGGMAEVHLANAAATNAAPELVVVKRMHQQHVDDAAIERMFLDEARLALRLSHPNIVRTDRVGVFDGRQGIVMEFLDGQPFHEVLKRACLAGSQLNLEIAVQVAIAALDGLHYAHQLSDPAGSPLGIVHRDVSPQNLFLTYDGAVKLLDFGIAKNALQDGHTRTGLLKGKISYMAPEQARGDVVDHRADLWSLGVVLWEAIAGSRLFKGKNEAATLNLTLSEAVASPASHRPDLPAELEVIVMRALRRDPRERYATAAAMRDDLEAWLSSRDLGPDGSIAQLMQRLFAREVREQRQRIQALLHAPPEPATEGGVTLAVPAAGPPGTLSGVRGGTSVSSITDLVAELTRQRRATTRLLGGFMALSAAVLLACLYLFFARGPIVAARGTSDARVLEVPRAAAPGLLARPAVAPAAPINVPVAAMPGPVYSTGATPRSAAAPASRVRRGARAHVAETVKVEEEDARSVEPQAGLLNLDTTPWSTVRLGRRILGQTPLVGVSLPVGVHSLILSNSELGLQTTYQVTIAAGQTTKRRIGLD